MMNIKLNEGMTKFNVFLHDKDFFMHSLDPILIPHTALQNLKSHIIKLVTSRNKRMNRESEFQCNDEKNYNFNQCVRQNLIDKIGCRYPWDDVEDNVQECNETKEILDYEKAYQDMFYYDRKKLKVKAGCKVPCQYQHYALVGTPANFETAVPYFILQFASTDVTTNEEVLNFPFESLVCEFGGSLGLFLGFSFFGTFDILVSLIASFKARFQQDQETEIQVAEDTE